ncbi:fructose-1-phosphate phosphatase YqaB [Peptococcaceae bacterium CEB3]|nr:fructose-1-phosphate phosphatase YqaB [Peptococcaceae bacterium CEB3]
MGRLKALILDCDGVIAETERDGHRVSFNRVFEEEGINAYWSVEEYEKLLRVGGGKERMKAYFEERNELFPRYRFNDEDIKRLHRRKTEIFMDMSAKGELPIRPGIKRLVLEAYDKGILLVVCSTSNEKSVRALIKSVMGEQAVDYFDGIFAGDIVKAKKPAPDIYNLAKERFNLKGDECIVIEDNRNGLLAAKGAGMYCVVTVSFYSQKEELKEADLVVESLGDPGKPANVMKSNPRVHGNIEYITIDILERLIEKAGGSQ